MAVKRLTLSNVSAEEQEAIIAHYDLMDKLEAERDLLQATNATLSQDNENLKGVNRKYYERFTQAEQEEEDGETEGIKIPPVKSFEDIASELVTSKKGK